MVPGEQAKRPGPPLIEHGADPSFPKFPYAGSDVHPMHFHLVNVQLLQRQAFKGDPSQYALDGHPTPPEPNETGWKETVRCNPGEVTTVAMKFDLPKLPTAEMTSAVSPRTGGHEYVCTATSSSTRSTT